MAKNTTLGPPERYHSRPLAYNGTRIEFWKQENMRKDCHWTESCFGPPVQTEMGGKAPQFPHPIFFCPIRVSQLFTICWCLSVDMSIFHFLSVGTVDRSTDQQSVDMSTYQQMRFCVPDNHVVCRSVNVFWRIDRSTDQQITCRHFNKVDFFSTSRRPGTKFYVASQI